MLPIIPELIADQHTLFVANHSGGKDSQAALIEILAQGVPAKQIVVVHASLGEIEWPGALEHAEQHAKAVGCNFIVARASKTMFDMVRHRHAVRPDAPAWPDSKRRQCTSDLKRNPIEREVRRYAKAHGFATIVNVLGLRAQESSGRRKRPAFSEVTRHRNKKTGQWVADRPWYEWLPIHKLTTEQVFASIKAAGQKPHYAYSLGNERLSCIFCIMSSKGDLACGRKHNPAVFDKYVALEKEVGWNMHMKRRPLTELVKEAEANVDALAA